MKHICILVFLMSVSATGVAYADAWDADLQDSLEAMDRPISDSDLLQHKDDLAKAAELRTHSRFEKLERRVGELERTLRTMGQKVRTMDRIVDDLKRRR